MSSPESASVRAKIMQSAGPLFADFGYEIVSIREIAALADVHFSAINYHFGSKENLYVETLRYASSCDDVDGYIQRRQGDHEDPVPQLRELAGLFLKDYMTNPETTWSIRLVAREILKPSPFADVLHEIWTPWLDHVSQLTGRLAGTDPASAEARFRSAVFFMILDSIGQNHTIIGAFLGHAKGTEWLVDQVMDLFQPKTATAGNV